MKKVLLAVILVAIAMAASGTVLAAGSTVHVVQPGQTLVGIARWYGVDFWTLASTNGIVNPNRIYVGQRLVIPSSGSYVAPGMTYTVRRGDTLYSIAGRYGMTAWALAQANGIYNLHYIYVGQRLIIPGARPVPAPAPAVPPAPAPVVQGWRGEYFTGTEPSGGPVVVRNDSAINFHWGYGGPDTRVGTDNFSAHWTRSINFIGGVYRLKTRTDDGVRIWVDQNLVLDAWRVQPETDYSVDVTLDPGRHVITVDYFESSGIATIQFSFSRLGWVTPATPVPVPTVAPPSVSTAWYGEYFDNQDLSGSPAAVRWDGAIGFEWGTGTPIGGVGEDHFSVRWRRTADFYSDNYAFCAMSDDGVRLYLDGVRVLDEWHGSNSVAYCGEANVAAGTHEMRAEYYEDGGNALIYVWWERR